jgi:hypothetical protein
MSSNGSEGMRTPDYEGFVERDQTLPGVGMTTTLVA